MPHMLRTSVKDYYDNTPTLDNSSGDIWSDLPSYNLIGRSTINGVVITPACDLSNRKVETISYLPIIPVKAYFATPAFMPDIVREIKSQLEQAQLSGLIKLPLSFLPPTLEALQEHTEILEEALSQKGLSPKVKENLHRAEAGVRLLCNISRPDIIESSSSDLRILLGEKLWKSTISRIVTNSYRLDIHFLPYDEQPLEWSGVPCHSLVLFRYPLTAPIEIFENAQDTQLDNWDLAIRKISTVIPSASAFAQKRPLKRLSLRPRFLSDLLTRYVAMHVRLGSPDFTESTVSQYVEQIGED